MAKGLLGADSISTSTQTVIIDDLVAKVNAMSDLGAYRLFSTSALPTKGYLRQGTGPYSGTTYPQLATVMPAASLNTIINTGIASPTSQVSKVGSNTLVVYGATTYAYSTDEGKSWTTVTHNLTMAETADANLNYALFPAYYDTGSALIVDLNSPGSFSTKTVGFNQCHRCTAAGSSVFLANTRVTGKGNLLYRSTDNFSTSGTTTLPASFLSTDNPPPMARGSYLTTTVIAIRETYNANKIARSANAGDATVATSAVTWSEITLPSTSTLASIATSGTGKWLLTTVAGATNSGFFSNDDGLTWTAFTSPNTSTTFNIAGWDGSHWIMTGGGETSFYWSSTAETGSWTNRSLVGYTIPNASVASYFAKTTSAGLWFPSTTSQRLIELRVIPTSFNIPAITEPTNGQYWVAAF